MTAPARRRGGGSRRQSRAEAFRAGLDLVRRSVVLGACKKKAEIDLMGRGPIDGDACVTHVYPPEAFEEALDRKPRPGEVRVEVILDPRLQPRLRKEKAGTT